MQSTKIDIARLGNEPVELRWELEPGWLARELEGVAHADSALEAAVTLSISRLGSKVQVSGQLSARFSVPCGRCLEPAPVSHDEPFFMIYEAQEASSALPEELELTADDLHWECFDGPEIDLGPLLREQLILGIPMTPLCAPECPGLPQPGLPDEDEGVASGEKPMDPRWNALAKLKRSR